MSTYNHSHYTQKKTRPCHQQAMFTLQKIFPQVNLTSLSKNSSVWEMLQKSAKNLPRPCLGDITSTISNMKCVVDNQQLKIQKNMIQIQRQQQIIMSTQKLQQQQYMNQQRQLAAGTRYGKYNNSNNNQHHQKSKITKSLFTGNENYNIDNFQQQQQYQQQQSSSYYPQSSSQLYDSMNNNINNNQMDEQHQQDYSKMQINSKQQQFFINNNDDQIDYFTPCNPVRESFICDNDQDLDDVKKYLVFDF